jgi:hypothetical protein
VTNRIFVANNGYTTVAVVDGASHRVIPSFFTIPTGIMASDLAVNPVDGSLYVANYSSGYVTATATRPRHDCGVIVAIDTSVGYVTQLSQPNIYGRAVNRWAGNRTDIMGVINDALPCPNSWQWAAGPFDSTSSDSIGFSFNWGDTLCWGENFVSFLPLEMQAATSNNLGQGTPFAGNRLVYPIYRIDTTAYGVEGQPGQTPLAKGRLLPCYPNPSSGKVNFRYQLPGAAKVTLSVYNIAGQAVKRMEMGTQPAGSHQAAWNADKLSAGVYFYRLQARLCQGSGGQAGEFTATKKLLIVK